MTLGELITVLGVDSTELDTAGGRLKNFEKEANKSMKSVQQRMDMVSKSMVSFGKKATTYVTLPLVVAAGAAFKFASDMQESINKVDVAFGNNADSVKKWSETTLTAYGISKGSALDMAALYGDMATSMGLATDKASVMSKSIVGLAGDVASFKNIQISQAQTALAGIFTGETESLKRLGIVMTEVNLKEYALSKGIKQRVQDMTQAEKVQLRYNYVLSVTKNAQGDFARTSDGAANQMRIFIESIKGVAAEFGMTFLPMATAAIKKVNSFIQWVGDLTEAQKKLVVGTLAVVAAIGPVVLIVGKAIQVFSALKLAMLSNPYTAVALGIAAVTVGVISFINAHREADSYVQDLNKSIGSEIFSLNSLFTSLKEAEIGTKARNTAIEIANTRYGSYLTNLLTEKSTLEDVATAQKQATNAIIASLSLKAYKDKLEKELGGLSDSFDKEFKTFLSGFSKVYGADRIGEFIAELYSGADAAIAAGGGKIERGMSTLAGKLESSTVAQDIYLKWVKDISKTTGYLDYSFSDFQNAFLNFAETKAKSIPMVEQLKGMVTAFQAMISVEEVATNSLENFGGSVKTVAETMAEYQTGLQIISVSSQILGKDYDKMGEKASLLESTLKELIKNGMSPTDPVIKNMALNLKTLQLALQNSKSDAEEFIQEFESMMDLDFTNLTNPKSNPLLNMDVIAAKLRTSLLQAKTSALDFGKSFDYVGTEIEAYKSAIESIRALGGPISSEQLQMLEAYKIKIKELQTEMDILATKKQIYTAMGQAAADMATALGTAFVDSSNAAVKLMEIILTTTQQIISTLLVKAVAAMLAGEAVKGLPGLITGAIGVAALLALFKSSQSKAHSAGAAKMAGGGVVPPGYPNDSFPALLTSGEEVRNPLQLKSLNREHIEINVVVEGVTRGQDIYYVVKEVERRLFNSN